jgi:hypothetical protein
VVRSRYDLLTSGAGVQIPNRITTFSIFQNLKLKFPKKAQTDMSMTLLIDGDWLVYAAGFAGQKTRYFAPQLGNDEFANMTEVKEEAKAQNDGEPDTGPVYSRTIVDPLDHILHSAKNLLNSQIEKAREKFGDLDDVIVYVDGDGNFRNLGKAGRVHRH